jgi:hypothetical protein
LQDKPWIARDSVKQAAIYRRSILIPQFQQGQVVLVEFGAVNYGAEVYLVDGAKETRVGAHEGPMMPFYADLTPNVAPGKDYVLEVKAFPQAVCKTGVPSGFIYPDAWTKPAKGWACRFSAGITKYVRLAVYPIVRISDIFVRTSVDKTELSVQVTVQNYSSQLQTVALHGELSPWKHEAWNYPSLPDSAPVEIAAGSERTVVLGPVLWSLGPKSYWWPNKPFQEDYQAVLHNLNVTLTVGNHLVQKRTQRFGFVEWTEGSYYYLVNGIRINYLSDATPEPGMSEYDCYSVSPAFLPPTVLGTGCPETWKRYMRLGICSNRIHQSTPTPYMMDVADEVGFMLIPETGIRGYSPGLHWDGAGFTNAEREIAMLCRTHPSVCRYSLQNECDPKWVPAEADALVTVDDTRPLVFEDNIQKKPGIVNGQHAHAYPMLHYRSFKTPIKEICGMGESAWPRPGPEEFVAQAVNGRCMDVCYYSGWDWLNYWPNFLEGMSYKRHAWKQANSVYPKDRQDGVDGWNSPLIHWVQTLFSPYLVLDRDFYFQNQMFDQSWPRKIPAVSAGDQVTRRLEIFNDGLFGNRLTVSWEAHWDSENGTTAASGELPAVNADPGFHTSANFVFTAPSVSTPRTLYLILKARKDGVLVFKDDQIRFLVRNAK